MREAFFAVYTVNEKSIFYAVPDVNPGFVPVQGGQGTVMSKIDTRFPGYGAPSASNKGRT